mmetsp:Transcript_77595/g.225181  ORF Transcript_77595/g.225181 Transcript_77595/m.225181 type:complete len:1855 (+) Transcript_77595:102-5666(+)
MSEANDIAMLARASMANGGDDNDIAMAIGLGSRRRDAFTSDVVKILQENMESLQEMEEEKFKIEEERNRIEEEKFRLEAELDQVVTSYLEQKRKLEKKMTEEKEQAREQIERMKEAARLQIKEKEQARKEMEEYRAQLEREMKEEKANMEKHLQELRAESARLEAEKNDTMRKMEAFRLESEQTMAENKAAMSQEKERFERERERMARQKAETESMMEHFRAEAEKEMVVQRERMEQEAVEFRKKIDSMTAEHEAEMRKKAKEFEDERKRLAAEKADMEKRMADFHAECQNLMAEEEAEMSERTERQRREHEQHMEEICRQFETQRKEHETRLAAEQEQARIEMLHFREVCEREMAEEKEEMGKRMTALSAECQRLEEDKIEVAKRLDLAKAEFDAVQREKAEMQKQAEEFKAECAKKERDAKKSMERIRAEADAQIAKEHSLAEERLRQARQQADQQFEAECKRLAEEQEAMTANFAKLRSQMQKEKAQMEQQSKSLARECSLKHDENEALKKRTQEFLAERNRLAEEKVTMIREMERFRIESKRKMQTEELETKQRTAAMRADYDRKLAEEQAQMKAKFEKKATEFEAERKRLAEEKAEMTRQMDAFKGECERKIAAEEKEMQRRTSEFRAEYERKAAEEKAAAERRLEEARRHTEEQLRTEREVTEHIKVVLRELPPLQAAMELGDLYLLEEELWKWRSEVLPERFGDCKGVVEAVVKLGKERLKTWRAVDHTWKDILREVETLPTSLQILTQQSQRLFRALKEAQLTKMDLRRSDPKAMDKFCEVLLAWQSRAMAHSNIVQERIIRKVVHSPNLGPFDFTDLDICLRLVDRTESDSRVFLSRVLALVDNEKTEVKDLRSLLSHVETMLFFLKYAKSEDLALTHAEFRKQFPKLDPAVVRLLQGAEKDYPPGGELVMFKEERDLFNGTDVRTVLEELRTPKAAPGRVRTADGLGIFREIFYQWALTMQSKFNLLVLPHHTQVVCLVTFRRFLEAVGDKGANAPSVDNIRALIAQVGTGEGKSMIVAALAIYVVVALGKRVHVVVDDETLLERDFTTFKALFDTFQVKGKNGTKRYINSVLCVSEERLTAAGSGAAARGFVARVDPDADICYCEAKHVQSFYASIARSETRDFSHYQERVLILDEVDALVIDEEPNEAFVYPNQELSKMATQIAEHLKKGVTPDKLRSMFSHPSAPRVIGLMLKEWEQAKKMVNGEDIVYGKDHGKYLLLQSGRVNPKAWSLALECRNYMDKLTRDILWQERMFVMSRPRVFRKYFRILGLSGSIGSQPERQFLQETYRAAFFEVPPFLKTCKGAPFHDAVPVPMGQLRQPVYVERNAQAQFARVAEVVLEAREKVPVLIIAKERGQADQLVDYLLQAARSHGLGRVSEDMVRSLSRTLYESDPEQWKENLNRSMMPMGEMDGSGGNQKSWRITVTDPRGGRGTDYRVDDRGVDAAGGLLLVPTAVPSSQRDWIQFLGRTARQDRHGQYCAVLCEADYEPLLAKYGGKLTTGPVDTIKVILDWGDREAAGRIQASAALYNNGVRMNEVCEEIFGKRPEFLKDPSAREMLVDTCQRHRWMSVREVDQAFARLPGFDPSAIPTEAKEMGRPAEPPAGAVSVSRPINGAGGAPAEGGGAGASDVPRIVIFCLDWSASMMSRDTGGPMTRFELCVKSVQQLLQRQVRDQDYAGVVCFGPQVSTIVAPTRKDSGSQLLRTKIAGLRPQTAGGTQFFDAVAECLQLLNKSEASRPDASRWLICLTDGDDLGSRRENSQGQFVNRSLDAGVPPNLNMVMITVGALKREMTNTISSWVEKTKSRGGFAQLLSEKDAGNITMAFQVVAECLAAEVGGAVEI